MTVAAFMELALYGPQRGYYAGAARRSGRTGDFFTSADVGPLFGEILAVQIAEMFALLRTRHPAPGTGTQHPALTTRHAFDLVEAGASDGRLSADVLRAARERDLSFYESIRLHLVEASGAARAAHQATLGALGERLVSSASSLPDSFEGVLFANELLDAMPVHQIVMRGDGLRELYVDASAGGLALREGPPSTPALQAYLDRAGVRLEPGWRAEINLRAIDWIREAGRRLTRGFVVLIDYGHEAPELYSAAHASGTLTTFSSHQSRGPESSGPAWLQNPGARDITAHVDFTSIRAAAEADGLTSLALLDQTYFVLGLIAEWSPERLAEQARPLKTLIVPGGLGSVMKVLILGKNVGRPALRGCSFKVRMT